MLALILGSLALADTVQVIVTEAELAPAQPIALHQLYNVEMPVDLAAQALLNGDRSELVDRVPRQVVPKGTLLRETHLFPVGTKPGPDAFVPTGHQLVRVAVPGPQNFPLPTNHVDLWVRADDGACLAAETALVAAVDSADGTRITQLHTSEVMAAWVVVPEGALGFLGSAEAPALVLRNDIDRGRSEGPRCDDPDEEPP